jgi:hypothetical protein
MKNAIKWLLNTFGTQNKKSIEVANAYKEIFDFNNHNIKLILNDLTEYCNFKNTSFNAQSSNITNFNEGARDVLLHILELSEIDITELLNIYNLHNTQK